MAQESRRTELEDLDQALNRSRFPRIPRGLLLLSYTPVGLALTVLRACVSLQAIVLLLVFPEGKIKRFLLKIFAGVLGIVVTTEGFHRQGSYTRLYIANRLSHIDNIVLHLALNCITITTGGRAPPLSTLLPHHTFDTDDDDAVESEARDIPQLDENESLVDFTPYAFQPEATPTNGSHVLRFSSWPFALNCVLQPVAISVKRPFGIRVTTARSSGWWDLLWTLFVPCTFYHIRMLPPLECDKGESPEEFGRRVQQAIASELHIRKSQATKEDYLEWLAERPPPPPLASEPSVPLEPATSSSLSPEIETMVQKVITVLPQVPHTVVRKDLLKTNSVDVTISNFLEGKVQYNPVPTLQEATTSQQHSSTAPVRPRTTHTKQSVAPKSSAGNGGVTQRRSSGPKKPSLFSAGSSPALASMQRQLSLEERKRNLLEQARRKYREKKGLLPATDYK